MLFFPPPTTELVDSAGTTAASLTMDGLLLNNTLMPRPSLIEREQRNQQAQSLQQLFIMEQQLHQQQQQQHQLLLPLPAADKEHQQQLHPPNLLPLPPTFPQNVIPSLASDSLLSHQLAIPQPIPVNPFPTLTQLTAAIPSSGNFPQMLLQQHPMAMPPTSPCGLCRLPILDKNFLLVDSQSWHPDCVRCAVCGINLEQLGATCFAKDGFLFCRRDYLIKYGRRCERCGISIERGELVMRVPRPFPSETALFHVHCFSCISCGQMLQPGEQFTAGTNDQPGGPLFCRLHFHLNQGGQSAAEGGGYHFPQTKEEARFLTELNGPGTLEGHAKLLCSPSAALTPCGTNGNFLKLEQNKENPDSCVLSAGMTPGGNSMIGDECSLHCNGPNSDSGTPSAGGGHSSKQKRMRTSFKHHQLRTMKTYFSWNHNPDAKNLKELAQKTGLSKRVLQVWFQNARAKHRRNQQHKGSGANGGGGTPSAAGPGQQLQQMVAAMGGQIASLSMSAAYLPGNDGTVACLPSSPDLLLPESTPVESSPADIQCAQQQPSASAKANSLSPLGSSSMGAGSCSLNGGGSSGDEQSQSSEGSFQ